MPAEKTYRRLPLRDLLTDAEKRARDLAEHFHVTWLARAVDLHDLSRPLRRRSHYPTLLALANALKKLQEAGDETNRLVNYLQEQMQDIREHARRERINRL